MICRVLCVCVGLYTVEVVRAWPQRQALQHAQLNSQLFTTEKLQRSYSAASSATAVTREEKCIKVTQKLSYIYTKLILKFCCFINLKTNIKSRNNDFFYKKESFKNSQLIIGSLYLYSYYNIHIFL